jgi:trimethylamine--corrinoid protein Co-methyltransferase
MVLSLEQLLIDVETHKMARRAYQGIATDEDKWLEQVIDAVGPGGHFVEERSTVAGIRGGEWYVSKFGLHDTFEAWEAAGKPALLDEAREMVNHILATHEPLALGEDVERELDRIQAKAREVDG